MAYSLQEKCLEIYQNNSTILKCMTIVKTYNNFFTVATPFSYEI